MGCVDYVYYLLDRKCWQFIVGMLMSIIGITIAIIGMCGVMSDEIPISFFTGLFSMIIGIWIPHPSAGNIDYDDFIDEQKKKKQERKKDKKIKLTDDEIIEMGERQMDVNSKIKKYKQEEEEESSSESSSYATPKKL